MADGGYYEAYGSNVDNPAGLMPSMGSYRGDPGYDDPRSSNDKSPSQQPGGPGFYQDTYSSNSRTENQSSHLPPADAPSHADYSSLAAAGLGGGGSMFHDHLTAAGYMKVESRQMPPTSPGSSSAVAHAIALTQHTQRRPRSEKKPIPEESKDGKYFERRKRNNQAAKKSRDARKSREDEIAIRASFLEKENAILRAQVATLREEANSLRQLLLQKRSRP